ncbi:gluconate:H+ symporter [Virgibacillus halophilus]|uniref:Gluconate:H+ symporter n=1 Tax=Tigheibacillus halophilus TaxID=361280 RepID=A0ABU5C2G2_9BACI|nr:gluconate:H+ symporter [Virgibacillus halophilus]
MTGHDTQLLIITVCGILLLIALITSKLHMHPLVALLIVSVGVGLASGLNLDKIAESIENGAGSTLGETGLTVALGAMLGKLLADSGASERIASVILRGSGHKSLPWLMALAAFIIGIPMFFEVGLIMLLPLIFTVAKKLEVHGSVKGSPYIAIGIPVIAALATMHGMVPPHPGPLIAISAFHANLSMTMIYGFICAVPAVVLAGPIYSKFITPTMTVKPDKDLLDQYSPQTETNNDTPSIPITTAFAAILIPVLMMLLHAVAGTFFSEKSVFYKVAAFVGNPVIAMLIGVLAAIIMLGYARGTNTKTIRDSLGTSLKPIAGILLIIAGGGAFGEVLKDSGVGDAIVHLASGFSLSAITLGWVVAALLSVSTGSATVGIVGSTSLLAPLVAADPSINTALLTVAVGSGSLFFNYANHGGFWLVKESFGMSMGETFKTITIVQSIVGLVGLAMTLLLNFIVG